MNPSESILEHIKNSYEKFSHLNPPGLYMLIFAFLYNFIIYLANGYYFTYHRNKKISYIRELKEKKDKINTETNIKEFFLIDKQIQSLKSQPDKQIPFLISFALANFPIILFFNVEICRFPNRFSFPKDHPMIIHYPFASYAMKIIGSSIYPHIIKFPQSNPTNKIFHLFNFFNP